MLKSDALTQLKQLKQDIKASRNLQQGVVKGTHNKFGFVTLDAGKDVFLPADEMAKVLPGDRIEVEIKKEPKNKTFAVLEKLISSPTKVFYGKYVTRGKAHFVEADLPGHSPWFFIPPQKRGSAKAKDLVKCRITQHPFKHGKAQASIEAIVGAEQEAGVEWSYVIAKHGLRESWPEDVLREVDELSVVDSEKISDREDLTALDFVTIDAPTTQDMDDAIYAVPQDDGWQLKVAIADPAALIPENSAIEKEVLLRASASYLPGMHIPMLPKELSADICSLKQGEPRLAKVVEMNVSSIGEVTHSRIFNALIKSKAQLSYQSVSEHLEGQSTLADYNTQLNELEQVAKALLSRREQEALVHPGRQEFYLELNESRKISAIKPKPQTVAHRLVEECMIAANRCIASFLCENASSSLFVSHAGVRKDRREAVQRVLEQNCPSLGSLNLNELDSYVKAVQGLLADDSKSGFYRILSRQLERAAIVNAEAPHFGLGVSLYTTATSPLRRGLDYFAHRQLDQILKSGPVRAYSEEVANQLDERAQAIRAATHELEQWLKCQFMQKNDNELEVMVTRVFASGCQVRVLENGVEGMISSRDLEGKFSFNQDLLTLKGAGFSFELEQTLKVKVKQIDWRRKQIQFLPLKQSA